jgi:hypothetical protein
MANLGVDTIKSEDGNRGPILDADLDFSQSAYTVLPKGTTAQRPTGVAAGSLRFNTDTKLVEQYNGTDWVTLNSYGVGRGVFGGGYSISISPFNTSTIDYITISTTGNAETFGDLTQVRGYMSACSSSTRGVFGGGNTPTRTNTIDYITIASQGTNASDFGDLTQARVALSSCSSSTRGVFGGGNTPTTVNTIDYITIATTGNATDFGDLTVTKSDLSGCSSPIRGIFSGGFLTGTPTGTNTNVIDYITIATTGNATDFGDLTLSRYSPGSCSSSTRGVFGGGYTYPTGPTSQRNVIDYVTIASTGNATDFGDLTQARTYPGACSNNTRGVFGGGYGQYTGTPSVAPKYNIIDYITIASNGTNAQDFGDLTISRGALAACSDAHGGLA